MTITAAADGSALGNPGPAGWAWYIDDARWAAGGWRRGTNNMGELQAVLELFRATAHVDDDLLVLCDSQYVINSVVKWMPGWKRKGWRKADGQPVQNVELMQALDAAIEGRRYRFEWVRGHTGHALNEAADDRARAAATAFQRGSAVDAGPGFGGTPAPRSVADPAAAHGGDPAAAHGADPAAARTATLPGLFDLERPADDALVLRLGTADRRRLRRLAERGGTTPEEALVALLRAAD